MSWSDHPDVDDLDEDDHVADEGTHQPARAVTSDDGGKKSQATILVDLAMEAGAQCFRDDEQAYLYVPVEQHHETYVLRSKSGRAWLQHLFIDAMHKCAGAQAIADASNALEAFALRGPNHQVHVRIATTPDAIYLDLGDPTWRVLKMSGAGWTIVTDAPVRFRRPKGLLPLPVPLRGGSIAALRPFVNAPDDDMFMLLVADILAILRGRGPYPILALFGEQGTAKSTTAKVIKQLVDPSTAPLRSEPREPRDLMIAAANNHVLAFDNISTIKPWLSDCFCRLATGGGFSTRTLYENREEEIFDAVRPVILNGIPEFVERPDLVSRSIFQYPPPIPDHARRDERLFWPAFEAARPTILGALCDLVVPALQNEAGVNLTEKPRMADFAIWVVAAEPACFWEEGKFLQLYGGNREQAAEVVLEGEPVADLVKTFVAKSTETPKMWTGTATDLFEELKRITPDATQHQKDWYKNPRQVSDDLRRLAPALRQVGFHVISDPKHQKREPGTGRRLITIEQVEQKGSTSSQASHASQAQKSQANPGEQRDEGCDEVGYTGRSSSHPSSQEAVNESGPCDEGDVCDEVSPLRSNGSDAWAATDAAYKRGWQS